MLYKHRFRSMSPIRVFMQMGKDAIVLANKVLQTINHNGWNLFNFLKQYETVFLTNFCWCCYWHTFLYFFRIVFVTVWTITGTDWKNRHFKIQLQTLHCARVYTYIICSTSCHRLPHRGSFNRKHMHPRLIMLNQRFYYKLSFTVAFWMLDEFYF